MYIEQTRSTIGYTAGSAICAPPTTTLPTLARNEWLTACPSYLGPITTAPATSPSTLSSPPHERSSTPPPAPPFHQQGNQRHEDRRSINGPAHSRRHPGTPSAPALRPPALISPPSARPPRHPPYGPLLYHPRRHALAGGTRGGRGARRPGGGGARGGSFLAPSAGTEHLTGDLSATKRAEKDRLDIVAAVAMAAVGFQLPMWACAFCASLRMLNERHVMVRVGGGWETFLSYLQKHDPCRGGPAGRSEVRACRYKAKSPSLNISPDSYMVVGAHYRGKK
ncbi:unnamed protein product [Pleuronectes platessa]|uniref:GAR domain-containing protein n=1 Tax=Pleuronectes platessa TaxID=8262 RepID=A0A9N7TQD7_PLEPL|nr:unnamed protein product [Pleuronectes platessa]